MPEEKLTTCPTSCQTSRNKILDTDHALRYYPHCLNREF